MALIQWDISLSVGVKHIDDQHKELVELVNRFYKAIDEKKSETLIVKTVKDMKVYALYHFKTEENYFKQYKYPDTGLHMRQHAFFMRRVEAFQERIDNNEKLESAEIIKFLFVWFVNHIQQSDKKFYPFFLEYGPK